MKIAFVGVKRKYQELAPEYRDAFNQYHLELPFYFARDGRNWVTVTTVDYTDSPTKFSMGSAIQCVTEDFFKNQLQDFGYDVVIHWRKWFPDLYVPGALNLINCQDHSFGAEWQANAQQAFSEGKLYGILCFPTWHKENLLRECPWLPAERALDGVTLGVDTDIYEPGTKDPYQMLWASDPGRGLMGAVQLALELYRKDRRFVLNVCYPDYAQGVPQISHPAIKFHRNLNNGPTLWNLFNTSGILPYTSTFKEPSSRAHRQAQAAGSMVFYPPNMGSPSELMVDGVTGVVAPTTEWPARIFDLVQSGRWKELGENARKFALTENWEVQARRFNDLMRKILEERDV